MGGVGNASSRFPSSGGRVLVVHGCGTVHGLSRRSTRPLAQPIALAGYLHDGGVREEAIEDRGRGRDVAEKNAPVLGRSIRGDERRRRFMPTHEDLQEILGRVRSELFHAEVLEHEQVDARELLHELAAGASRVRLGEVAGEIERAAHERAAAGPNRADGDRRRDVRFADAEWPNEQHAVVGLDKPRTRQFDDLRLGDLGIEVPVEIGERLDDGDARLFEAARDACRFPPGGAAAWAAA